MRITSLHIENFRSVKSLDIQLGDTTVFIGPNNAGKTAILDAVRIALSRRWGQRGTGFTEYDIHLAHENDDPKTSSGIVIDIKAEEAAAGDWPVEVHQALTDIAQDDPITGRSSVTLRVGCAWSAAAGAIEPSWFFLNAARQPLVGGAARRMNLERFWQYMPAFYLGALRDAQDEFSARSQFWGRLLRAIEIPSELEARVQKVLEVVNRRLLAADPRLRLIAQTLGGATRIAARDRNGSVDLRVIPLKGWDLLSKAEIIVRNDPDSPWLPLQRHGQGLQSLTVIFLFRAFVEHLLTELFEPHSTAVLLLEEPETHLHPQAARNLWNHVSNLPGQKIITTHSPYFVQHVPFRDIRLVRLTERGTEVRWLPSSFSVSVPPAPQLSNVITRSDGLLEFDAASRQLTVRGELPESIYRELLTAYANHPERAVIHGVLRDLKEQSLLYMSDDELRALETYARRIRGEIFFARVWLLVEGQAEYLLVHAVARAVDYDLDEFGVSVIDAQNNGNPQTFAALGRALGIPWTAVFDGDAAGQGYVQSIVARGFDQALVAQRCRTLSAGKLEQQLIADGLEAELRSILQAIGVPNAANIDQSALERSLIQNKVRYVAELSARIPSDLSLANRMPQAFRDAISDLRMIS